MIGSSAKCSVDGHSLAVCLSPRAWATRHWQEFGSRSEADCYSFIITLPPSGECTRRERWHGLASPAHTLESRTGRPGLGGGDYRERSIGVEVPASPHQALVGGGTASTSRRREAAARGAGGERACEVHVDVACVARVDVRVCVRVVSVATSCRVVNAREWVERVGRRPGVSVSCFHTTPRIGTLRLT